MVQHMRIAIPLWQGRISPVFDEASRILIFDISKKQEQSHPQGALISQDPFERAQLFAKLKVDLLICGMISKAQQAAIISAGVRIIPHICGSIEDVLAAFLDGRIERGEMRMPGCGSPKQFRKINRKEV